MEIKIDTDLCAGCSFLNTTKPVNGQGNEMSRLVIIGRDPGKFEEQLGVPFVGRSGELLNTTLEKVGLNRINFYVTNVVKCRPKRNKTPEMEVVSKCFVHLESELKIVNPKLILLLGEDAKRIESRLTALFPSCIIVNAYHPSAILRNLSLYETFFKQLKGFKMLVDSTR